MALLAVAAIVLLSSIAQSAFGFGFALVLVPLTAFVIGPRTAIAASIVLSPLVSNAVYLEHRPRESPRRVAPLVIAALASFPIGLALLVHVNEAALRILVGLAVMAGAAVNLRGAGPAHAERPNRVPVMVVVGLLSGVLAGTTSMGGPPIVLYQHWVGGDAAAVRGRLLAYFGLQTAANVLIVLPSGVVTLDVVGYVLAGVPAIALGVVAGRAVRPRLSERWFRRLSMALLAVSAGTAVIGATLAIL